MYRLFSVHLFVFCFLLLFADLRAECVELSSIILDKTAVSYRHPSIEKIEAYKKMEAYDYNEVVETESWWDRFLRWITAKFSGVGLNPKFAYYVLIGIGSFLIVFYLLRMYGFKPIELLLFKQNKEIGELQFSQKADDLYKQDLNELLETCIRNKAYREAIRILYLSVVKNMDQSGLIVWQPWKTDRDYCYELSDIDMSQKFRKLVRSYEYIWYGQFVMKEEEFYIVKEKFDGFGRFVTTTNGEK